MIRPIDLELLFTAFAFRHAKIDNEQLGRAVARMESHGSIADTMVQTGMIDEAKRQQIDAAVKDHLRQHHDDSSASLAAINPLPFPLSLFDHLLETHAAIPDSLLTYQTVVPEVGHNIVANPNEHQRAAPPSSLTHPTSTNTPGIPTRYRSKRFHARGGLGEIYVATDMEVHRDIALKEIQNHYADNLASRQMFIVEGSITGSLEHPGVVPVYGMGQYEDGRPFYAMRLIRGESLKTAIKTLHSGEPLFPNGRDPSLALRQLLNRFLDVCNTIHYAHSRGVIHRDIKPDNIMLGPYGETLVVDWGLAAIFQHDSSRDAENLHDKLNGQTPRFESIRLTKDSDDKILGTAPYMSPEQASGRQSEMGPCSDVFSLGATLYTILTGTIMYPGTSTGRVLEKAKHRDAVAPTQINPSIPVALAAIVEKATAKLPSDRYQTAKQFADDLDAWLADEPVTAYRERWHERLRRWMRQHRTLVTSGIAALLMGIIALSVIAALLSTKNAEVAAQRDTAERNLIAARKAVRESFVQISEDERLKAEGLEQLRMKLLKSPEPYFIEFLSQNPDDPRLRLEQAQWRSLLAAIIHNTQSPTDAIKQYETVEKNLHDLGEEFESPDLALNDNNKTEFQSLRANTHLQLATLYDMTAEFDQSMNHARQAIAYADSLVTADMASISIAASTQLAKSQFTTGQTDAAITTLDEAINRRSSAAKRFSENWRLRLNHSLAERAECRAAEGDVLGAVDDWKTALSQSDEIEITRENEITVLEFRARALVSMARETGNARLRNPSLKYAEQAQKIAQQLVNRHPDNLSYAELKIDVENTMATTLAIAGPNPDPNAVRNGLTKGIELYGQLVNAHPSVVMYRYRLLKSRLNLVFADLSQGKAPDEIIQDATGVLSSVEQLAHEHPRIPDIQVLFAKTLINTAMLSMWFEDESAVSEIKRRFDLAKETLNQLDSLPNRVAYTEVRSSLYSVLGRLDQSNEQWADAAGKEAHRQQIMEQFPDTYWNVPFPNERKADSLDTEAQYRLGAGQVDAGFARLDNAIAVRETLVRDFPNEPVLRKNLATSLRDYGDWLKEFDLENAEVNSNAYTRKSLDVIKEVPLNELDNSQLLSIVGDLVQLATISSSDGEPETAADQCKRARQAAIELHRREPTSQNLAYQLLVENLLIGYLLDLDQNVDDLVNSLHQTVTAMLNEYDHSDDVRDTAMLAYRQTAAHFHSKKNYEQARYFLSEAYKISERSPQRNTIAINLSDAEIRLGSFLAGTERSAPLLGADELEPLSYYNLAVNFALAIRALQNDAHLSEPVRQSLSTWYQTNAIKGLEKAADAGLFDDPVWRSTFDADADLESIRETDDYREFTKARFPQEPNKTDP